MLRALTIRDFIIVDRLDLEFAPGFTVLTGETGAGKSILIDALTLLLGARGEAALVREGWEEAGLRPGVVAAATPGRVIHLYRDIPEGLQHEHLHVFDLPLPADAVPCNQDGEVAELWLAPIDQALALAAGSEMTVDAALVTLDFALRHGLLDDAALARRAAALWTAAPAAPGPVRS